MNKTTILNFIIGVIIIVIGMQLLGLETPETFPEWCQQMLGLIAIGIGCQFKLFKGE